MTEPTPYYRAWCKKCGCTVKTDDTSTWMDPFFLPENCPSCHRFHTRGGYRDSLYEYSYGFWKFVPDERQEPKVWWNPLTWGTAGEKVWTDWRSPEERAAIALNGEEGA